MSGIDYRLLRAAVSMERVLRLLQYRPTCRRGEQLRGPCPIHNPQLLGDGRCFSDCGAGGNQLDLWKLAQGLPLHAAALELCRQLNLPPPPKQQPRTDGKLKSRNSEPPPPRSATADLALPSPPEWPRF
jgi:hypothetical protein